MSEQITLDGRNLSGVDRFGDWKVTGLEGWWDTPDRKSQDSEREFADGDHDLPDNFEKRQITIEGRIRSSNHEMQHAAMNWLSGALVLGVGLLTVAGHGDPQWARVKLAGPTRYTIVTDRYVKFQVRLKCPDPRKFGESRTFTATTEESVAAHHKGNYVATPSFVVSGNMPGGYTLSLGGRNYTVTRVLSQNFPHSIDYRDGRLRVNGALIIGSVSYSNLKLVEPGLRTTLALTPLAGGSGSVACTVTDTFI